MDGQGEFKWPGTIFRGFSFMLIFLITFWLFLLDERKYNGSYVEDKKHGYGEFEWPDGRRYKG